MTTQERGHSGMRPPWAILFLYEEDPPSGKHREPPADGLRRRKTERLFNGIKCFPELFLSPNPTAAVRGEDIFHIRFRRRVCMREELTEPNGERLRSW